VIGRAASPGESSPEEGEGGNEFFVGGFIVSDPNVPLAKYRFTWPFARLTLAPRMLEFLERKGLVRDRC
jgi:hypothetical protein